MCTLHLSIYGQFYNFKNPINDNHITGVAPLKIQMAAVHPESLIIKKCLRNV